MKTYLVVLVLCILVDLLGRVMPIARGAPPARSFPGYLLDTLFNVCLLAWGIGLLVQS